MKRIVVIGALMGLGLASAARADVTVKSAVTVKALGRDMNGQSVHYIKGTRMRSENENTIFIHDATARQMIVLNDKKKEAEVYDMAKLGAEIQKTIGTKEPTVTFTATGQKKDIQGRSADEYMLTITLPVTVGSDTMNLVLSGPAWIAKGAPGTKDYTAFYKAAVENGLFFANPEQARAQGAQMKTTSEMYKAFAAAGGIPVQSEIQIKFEGTGMMAKMMSRMASASTTTMVTSISTDPIPDDKFGIPAGYKTVNK